MLNCPNTFRMSFCILKKQKQHFISHFKPNKNTNVIVIFCYLCFLSNLPWKRVKVITPVLYMPKTLRRSNQNRKNCLCIQIIFVVYQNESFTFSFLPLTHTFIYLMPLWVYNCQWMLLMMINFYDCLRIN